ncbi:hypothetical protein STANM309S_05921 [Streptomyces tanashiensis]
MDSAEALEVTSWTSEAMASTRSSWVCAERTVADASASRGTACSVTSATSRVVALSVCASLTSTTARKETRIAQNTATRIPATSPPVTVHRSLLSLGPVKSRPPTLSRPGCPAVPHYRPWNGSYENPIVRSARG